MRKVLVLMVLLTATVFGQVAVSPMNNPHVTFTDASGNPLSGGKLYSYIAGTSTPQNTYIDSTGVTPNSNPVVLDSSGSANVWLGSGVSYKLVLKSSSGVTLWTVDHVSNGVSPNTINVWTAAQTFADSITKKPIADIRGYGAVCDGTTDDSSALVSAYASGNPIYIPPSTNGCYFETGLVTSSPTGPVVVFGSGSASKVVSDVHWLNITGAAASKSSVKNLQVLPKSTFTVVAPGALPSGSFPILLDRFSDGIGYQPTVNDVDIYALLTTAQKNQDIGPSIVFTNANDVEISGITGKEFYALNQNGNNFNAHDNNFIGGKGGVYGCLGVIGSGGLTTATIDGANIHDNTVTDCGFSGIFIGNTKNARISNNFSSQNGESGIKTFQPSTQYPNVAFSIIGNKVISNYYDGIDASAATSHVATWASTGIISGNVVKSNHATGITTDGIGNNVSENYVENNGTTGILFDVVNGVLGNNVVKNNNTSNALVGENELVVGIAAATGSLVTGNRVTHTNGTGGGAGNFATSNTMQFVNNKADGSTFNWAGGNPISAFGNYDSTGAMLDIVAGNINLGGTATAAFALVGPRLAINGGTVITSQTGSSAVLVTNTSPTLVTPILGAASATSISMTGGTAPVVATPTVGQAACIKSAGPPYVIGYCSTVVSAGGACTCN